jgi:hypothetical protein
VQCREKWLVNAENAAVCSFRVKLRRLHLHLTIDLTPFLRTWLVRNQSCTENAR